jgi:hypothetical protein
VLRVYVSCVFWPAYPLRPYKNRNRTAFYSNPDRDRRVLYISRAPAFKMFCVVSKKLQKAHLTMLLEGALLIQSIHSNFILN